MEALLVAVTQKAVVVIDAMALVIIVVGAVEAFLMGIKVMFTAASNDEVRAVWSRLGRWLVAGLTFQLAADVIETAIAPQWDDIGRLGAIAVIRTFLNYFLERDLSDVEERQGQTTSGTPAAG
jgi:uncharacterized membrane protein